MPLFRNGCGGATPTSALQLQISKCSVHRAVELNQLWHSRLPKIDWTNIVRTKANICFVAEFNAIAYATAIWSSPIARYLNGKNWLELRRFAIAPNAPKNTASRMLRVMRLIISKELPQIVKLISCQDTDVHTGTIYKAAGWIPAYRNNGIDWNLSRKRNPSQSTAPKIRWEFQIKN